MKLNYKHKILQIIQIKAFILSLILFSYSPELFSQDYTITIKQRRMGDQIGVEFWIKGVSSSLPKIANMNLGVTYNSDHLSPANPETYNIRNTDEVDFNVDQYAPFPYRTFNSNFHNMNGYSALTTISEDDGTNYVHSLQVSIPNLPSNDGFVADTFGIGSFVGKIVFDIINHNNLTIDDMTNISFNKLQNIGKFTLKDVNANDLTSKSKLVESENMKIKGITILNPNRPNEIVNREKEYSFMITAGYPIYFERSGIFTPSAPSRYGTSNKLAYAFDYVVNYEESLSDGKQEWVEFLRIAEHRESSILLGGNIDNYSSGEITTSNGMSSGYYITQGNGEQLPVSSGDGYGGILRVIWDEDVTFPHETENARLRIRQLDTNGTNADILLRNDINDGTYDISDANFIMSRFSLDVNNSTNSDEVLIYPNPTSDMVNINTNEGIKIELFDLFGNKLLEDYNTKLNIGHLSPGTYFLKIQNQTLVVVKI